VARLHAKAPADRFGSAREVADLLAQRLAELQQGSLTTTNIQGTPQKVPAPPPHRPGRFRMTAAIIPLILLAGLGVSEGTGLTNIRGRVMRLFSSKSAPAATPLDSLDAATWEKTVAALPADKQVEAVAVRLKKLNPGFDGTVTPTITGDAVTILSLSTDQVTNITPVRALPKLTNLNVSGTQGTVRVAVKQNFLEVAGTQGKLIDLSPLQGMSLSVLSCSRTRVSNLSALKGMPLTRLEMALTDVSDLTPLAGMPLTHLFCGGCSHLSNLAQLKEMHLVALDVSGSGVWDLSPLTGMPLRELNLDDTQVKDLSQLKGMPLEILYLGRTAVTDLSPLQELTALHTLIINDMQITDLSSLINLRLKSLRMGRTRVADLSPLREMPLQEIWLNYEPALHAEVLRSLTTLQRINGKPASEFWKAQEKP
jgi:Leucine-rich repeat (LRR) protein